MKFLSSSYDIHPFSTSFTEFGHPLQIASQHQRRLNQQKRMASGLILKNMKFQSKDLSVSPPRDF